MVGEIMLLCDLNPISFECVYGELGLGGKIGYEDLLISVRSRYYTNALSFHPHGQVVYDINGDYEYFTAQIGFNDSSFPGTYCDFLIYADDVLVAAACNIGGNDEPREIFANLNGARTIKLVVETTSPIGCHPVWIQPSIHKEKHMLFPSVLGRAHGRIPDKISVCEKCIFTTLTPNYVDMLDNMLGSLFVNGECQDASLFFFVLNPDDKCKKLAKKYNATMFSITVENTQTLLLKSLVYSVASFINADYYLMLDADMIILRSLAPIFDTLKTTDERNILVSREENLIPSNFTLRHLISTDIFPYKGAEGDDVFLRIGHEGENTFIVNGGMIAGSRKAWLSLDSTMRSYMPRSSLWDIKNPSIKWREQAIFNLALAKTGLYTEISHLFNFQMCHVTPDIQIHENFIVAFYDKHLINVLHFNGLPGKEKYPPFERKFSHTLDCQFGINNFDAFSNITHLLQTFAKTIRTQPQLRVMYSDIDSIQKHVYIYKYLHDIVGKKNKPNILEINARAGLMTACLASSCSNVDGAITSVEMNPPNEYEQIISSLSDKEQQSVNKINEDILVYLKNSQDSSNKFDFIICGTHNSLRTISSQILLAYNLLSPNGKFYITDSKFPVCNISGLNRRLNSAGLQLVQVSENNISDLYFIQPYSEDEK